MPRTIRREIPRRVLRIGCSPHDYGKLETYWASGSSTISFSVTTVSIALQIRVGRCEATVNFLPYVPSNIFLSRPRMSTYSKTSRSLPHVVVCPCDSRRLKNRQHVERVHDVLSLVRPTRLVHKAISRRCGRQTGGDGLTLVLLYID